MASPSKRVLRIEYSGNLINHLGLKLYAGAVPALSELISNAWDADATGVTIDLPLNIPLNDSQQIVVSDDGRGMSWEDARDQYLVIGRDRRVTRGDKTRGGRSVMGRKGIGKLAGFGIARIVEVRTVRNRWLTHFRMNFDDMTGAAASKYVERYEPEILADTGSSEKNGTTITLKRLILQRRIDEEEFRESMSRRFAILTDQFVVAVNGEPLQRGIPLQFRFPPKGVDVTDIPGFGRIRFWIGFTERPIKSPDGRGISVVVRGKLAQVPFFFGIRGGISAQHALEYMTGEVEADQLDDRIDYIGTNRQEIVWSEPFPSLLAMWGQEVVKDSANRWRTLRSEAELRVVLDAPGDDQSTISARLKRLPARQQKEARELIELLIRSSDATDNAYLQSVIGGILSVFEDKSTDALLTDLRKAPDGDTLERFAREYGATDRAKLGALLRGRRQAIGALQAARAKNLDTAWLTIVEENTWILLGAWTLSAVNHELTKRIRKLSSTTQLSKSLANYNFVVAQQAARIQVIAIGQNWRAGHLSPLQSLTESFASGIAPLRLAKPPLVILAQNLGEETRSQQYQILKLDSVIDRALRSFHVATALIAENSPDAPSS